MKGKAVHFTNDNGDKLSGILELPVERKPAHFAIFAHCFTCSKDLRAARNITLALSQKGFGVLRFDFTGLGESEGDFEDTNFTSNLNDIAAAAAFLEENYTSPSLLVGHSLGGTAVLMAGSQMESVKAIAAIGAPCEPDHVLKLLKEDIDNIRKEGKATVKLAGREFSIKSHFVEDLEAQGMQRILEDMRGKALLVMHSPQDETVEVINARAIYESAHHPKSFVSLDGADHLLSDKADSLYAGDLIASWVQRYLPAMETPGDEEHSEEQVMARLGEGPFLTEILAGHHHLLADEPESVGGQDLGPSPYDLLTAGLGACTAMTIKMYSNRKEWDLQEVIVHLNYNNDYLEDCENCENEERKIGRFERIIELKGKLDEKQRKRILSIANKCPVHKTLEQGITIETRLKEVDAEKGE
ncbi:MAG TPA: osmotically inducible protein C [Cryomorphaceae bacterium]|nr:osmotically inducible protein C [Owenweeksia sp.]MBG00216.1 osmotically inducible protein C [Owenweeksia sp.]HAD98127.1 osmotically inducible protein C [Cryomorphaceae bacterium]HBF19065.1 osmotically inducible protein C [Cryomorphaceae bacterium]|tara:strand:- start:2013 stop:3254 length:1242 start_codon:yes stop_codon:yes gene_type:complete